MIGLVASRVVTGHAFGFRHKAADLMFRTGPDAETLRRLGALQIALRALLPLDARAALPLSSGAIAGEGTPADAIWATLQAFDLGSGVPTFGRIDLPVPPSGSADTPRSGALFRAIVETVAPDVVMGAAALVASEVSSMVTAPEGAAEEAALQTRLKDPVRRIVSRAPAGDRSSTNFRHFLRAAHEMDVPALPLPEGFVQFGWGCRSKLTQSAFTEYTPAISTRIARDKALTHEFLSLAGLPVPEQHIAVSVETALRAARNLGYPVVIKPVSLDGGAGVTTLIGSDDALSAAVGRGLELAKALLVQRHIDGGEYRLLIVGGRLLSVHERVPARVVGNGADPIAVLIETENAARIERRRAGASDVPIRIVDDTHRILSAQGLTMETILAPGETARLATVPTVRSGGKVQPLRAADLHPDLVADASRAVRQLRLDVAGVDVITSDPARPLSEVGGAITEVNACPQINRIDGIDVHRMFLEETLRGAGRVPAALLLGPASAATPFVAQVASLVRDDLQAGGLGLVAETREDVRACPEGVAACTDPDTVAALLTDRRIGALLAVSSVQAIRNRGLPLDRFDAVAFPADPTLQDLAFLTSPPASPHLAGPFLLMRPYAVPKPVLAALVRKGIRRFATTAGMAEGLVHLLRQRRGCAEPERAG